jgi:hypothetical protein
VSGRGVTITWKDGLPDDRFERAQIEQILTESGLTSQYSAIKRLREGDDAEAREEMERIAQEKAADANREAAMALPVEEEPLLEKSESSNRTMARLKADRGQNDNQGGRQKKGPKRGG